MKKIFLLFCTCIVLSAAYAQCPQYVAFDTTVCGTSINRTIDATVMESRLCGDTFTVVFNDSTTALNGSRQVYFHAGPEFRPFTGWQAAYTADSAMQRIGTHLWTISFNPRNFFNFSPDSCLNSIACGFRDSGFVNYVKCGANDIYVVVATGTAVNTCVSATFMTAAYTHSTNISYAWSDGPTNGVRTFTTGGDYTVTATGAGGCTATGSVRIILDSLRVSIGDDTVECATASYVFVATPGFSTYQWLDAAPFTSNTQQAINPGMYWVHAVDSFGCASNDTATVHLSPTGYLSLPDTLSSCPGVLVSVDASTNINFNGDSIVIIYNATRGQTALAGDTNVYFHSAPQFYPFAAWPVGDPYTVGNWGLNDGLGRMQSLGNNLWRIAIDPQSYYHYSPDTPLNGIWMVFRNFDGTLTGKDTNGNNIFVYTVPNPPTSTFDGVTAFHTATQPVTYTWNDGTHNPAKTFTTGGTYKLTVTDGVCTHSDSVVAVFSNSATINIGADTTICSIADTVIINAGAGYAHYAWSNGDTVQTIKVYTPNTYSVTVISGSGCTSTGHRNVSVSSHTLSLGPDIVKCANSPTLLMANSGFQSYQWIDEAATASDSFTAHETGCYWVVATDSAGCVFKDTVSVRYSEVLQLNLTDTLRNCPGNLVNLDANDNITLSGDSITIFYDATQGQTGLVGANKVYMHSAPQFYPFATWPGTDPYTVGDWGLDDGVGEMDSLGNNRWSITICPQCYYHFSPDTPLNGIWMVFRNANGTQTGKDDNGNNILLYLGGPTPTSTFTGVTAIHKAAGILSYHWSTGSTSPSIAVGTTGQYIVTVSDNSGCSNSDTSEVIIANTLTVNIGNDTAICPSGEVRFNAGPGYTSYHWNNGDTTQAITVSAPGIYSVTVTGGNCMAIDSARLSWSGVKINLGADITRCQHNPVTLTAPGGYLLYQWMGAAFSSQTYTADNDGCYWIEATDSTGCTSYDTICVMTSGVMGLHSRDTLNACIGSHSAFDASVNVNAAGDSLVITYDATQGQSQLQGANKVYFHSGPAFSPTNIWPGPYTVGNWGLDDGVGEMDSLGNNLWRITIFPSCYYGYSPDSPLYSIFMVFRNADGTETGKDNNGDNIQLNIIGSPTGAPSSTFGGVTAGFKANSNISYSWSGGSHNAVDSFTASGTYYVTASDGTCTKTDTLTVTENIPPSVQLGNDTCLSGGTVILNGGSGYTTYLWSTGASTQTITVTQPNTYWVRVTAPDGCTGSDTLLVNRGVAPNFGKDTCFTTGHSILLNAGAGAIAYHWSTGATTDTIRVSTAGTYSVAVSDGACSVNDTVVVTGCGSVDTAGCAGLAAHFRVLDISPDNIVTIKDSSIHANEYTWIFGPGDTAHTAGNIAFAFSGSGIDTIILIVKDTPCTATSTMTLIVPVNVAGIAEIKGLNSINLYPNPASNNCTIELNAMENMEMTVSVSDMLGEIIASQKWRVNAGDNKLEMDLAGMASGMYSLTLRSASGVVTRKLNIIK